MKYPSKEFVIENINTYNVLFECSWWNICENQFNYDKYIIEVKLLILIEKLGKVVGI